MLKSLNTTKPSRSLTRTKKRLALTLISMLFCLNSCSCRFDEKGFTFDRRTLSDTFDDATNKAKQGDLKGALEDYSIILRSSPDAPTYVNRGLVYVYLGDYDAAMEDFNAASEIDPNNFEIYINRGSTRATLRGDLKGAIPILIKLFVLTLNRLGLIILDVQPEEILEIIRRYQGL